MCDNRQTEATLASLMTWVLKDGAMPRTVPLIHDDGAKARWCKTPSSPRIPRPRPAQRSLAIGLRPLADRFPAIRSRVLEKSAEDFDSQSIRKVVFSAFPIAVTQGGSVMTRKKCAACDGALDGSAIQVKIGTRIVAVWCNECAQELREASREQKS